MPSRLAEAVFWAAVVCCTIAQLQIMRSTVRSSRHASRGPSSLAIRELAWVTLPGIALAAIFVLTWREMHP